MGEKKARGSNRSSNRQKILISFMTLILVCAVFFGAYYFMSNKTDSQYVNSLCQVKTEVDKANNSAEQLISSIDSINIRDTGKINQIKSDMLKIETNMQTALGDLKKIAPPAKYAAQYKAYVEGVTLNKKIYTQAYLILKNTKSKDLSKALESLYKYVSDSQKAYDSGKLGKSYIELPSGILTLPDKIHQFAFKSYDDYEAKTRLLEQYTAYFDAMDKINKNYQDAQTNLNLNLNGIKNSTTTIENVYIEIEKKLTALTDIQNSYNNLTVPPKEANQHQKFNDILKRYTYYCQDFKTALTNYEEAGQDEAKLQEVTSVFDELEVRYKEIEKTFADYYEAFIGDKTYYSDENNL